MLVGLGLARRQTWQRLRLLLGALGIGGNAGLALLFAFKAQSEGREVYWLAALAFAVSVPALLFEFVHALREARIQYDDTPVGLLHHARARIAARQRSLWGCRIAAIILALSTLALLWLFAIGRHTLRETLTLGVTWGVTALGTWAWQARRGRQLAVESARCRQMLAEYDAA